MPPITASPPHSSIHKMLKAKIMVAMIPGGLVMGIPIAVMAAQEQANAVLIAVAVVGFFVALVPVVYLSTAWMFTLPLILDKGLGFWEAMETGRKVVHRHWWQAFGLFLVVWLINLVGVMLCCVGVFLTAPLGVAALMAGYETLFSEREGQGA